MNKKINMILLKIYPRLFWYSDGEPNAALIAFMINLWKLQQLILMELFVSLTLIVRSAGHLLKNGVMDITTQITWSQHLGGIFGNN